MNTYYVAGLPFSDQNALSHGRTFGSKNGISHTPGYIAKGKRAKGPQIISDSGTGTVQKTYSQGADFAASMVNTSTKRGKKKTGGKKRHKGEGRTYETDAYGNEIHYGSTTTSRGAINRASKKIKNFRSKQSAVGTAFASTSADDMVPRTGELRGTARRLGATLQGRNLASMWDRFVFRGRKDIPKERDRLTKAAQKWSQKINPHKTMSSIEKNARIAAAKVSGFVSKHGQTAVAAITAVAGKAKNLLGGLFGKKKK